MRVQAGVRLPWAAIPFEFSSRVGFKSSLLLQSERGLAGVVEDVLGTSTRSIPHRTSPFYAGRRKTGNPSISGIDRRNQWCYAAGKSGGNYKEGSGLSLTAKYSRRRASLVHSGMESAYHVRVASGGNCGPNFPVSVRKSRSSRNAASICSGVSRRDRRSLSTSSGT